MKTYSIYGPPGTGKTTEMINRVSAATRDGVPESSVYLLSFTKAAARESQQRVGLVSSDNFCTIHSLCYRLTGIHKNSVVNDKKLADLSELTGVKFSPTTGEGEELADGNLYLQILSRADNLLLPAEEVYETSDRPGTFDEFSMVVQTYRRWKNAYGYVDFNDMLVRALKKPVKFAARRIYIDEAQDLTPLQWAVIDRLIDVSSPDEVHIAGDDDQCIYEYGGANPRGMHAFEEKYGACRSVLEQSWRVPKAVHKLAHDVIHRVEHRVDKKYKAKDAEGVVSFSADINSLPIEHGEDVMILGRTRSIVAAVEQILRDRQIPYVKFGGISLFNNRYALSIRAVLKARRGESLSDAEYNALLKTACPSIRPDIEVGDNRALGRGHWKDVLNIPYNLMSYYENVDIEREPTIRLSTIHAVKGKEADRVILMADQTPRVQEAMGTPRGADNEHRCMYVGITRAKRQLDVIIDDEGYML